MSSILDTNETIDRALELLGAINDDARREATQLYMSIKDESEANDAVQFFAYKAGLLRTYSTNLNPSEWAFC